MNKVEKKRKARNEIEIYKTTKDNFYNDKITNQHIRSKIFMQWYVQEIYNKSTSNEISEDDFDLGYVDQKNDLNIDFIHKQDGQVLMIQAKHRGSGVAEDEKEIHHFKDVLNKIESKKYSPHTKLFDLLSDIDLQNDRFKIYYITLGKITGNAKIAADREVAFNESISNIGERIDEFEFYDESDIDDLFRKSLTSSQNIDNETFEIYAAEDKTGNRNIIDIFAGDKRQIIFVTNANKLVEDVYNRRGVGNALFGLNIRNYVGNIGFNKGIFNTADNEPERFFYFNNGISCLAKSLDVDSKSGKITVSGLQVINGAQTIKTLDKVKRKTNDINRIKLLVRITETGDSYGADNEKFISDVTQYNNSQTAIKDADFRSNDAIQIDIENRFKNIKIHSGRVIYLRKRTERKSNIGDILIKFDEFTKVQHAFIVDPISFSSSTKYLFDDTSNGEYVGGYLKIYGDSKNTYDSFTNEEFMFRASIWWLGSSFLTQIKKESKLINDRIKTLQKGSEEFNNLNLRLLSLQAKWFIIFASKHLLLRTYGEEYKTLISKYYEKPWILGEKTLGKWLQEVYELSRDVVLDIYSEASLNENFIHRNWLRSKETMERVQKKCMTGTRLNITSRLPEFD